MTGFTVSSKTQYDLADTQQTLFKLMRIMLGVWVDEQGNSYDEKVAAAAIALTAVTAYGLFYTNAIEAGTGSLVNIAKGSLGTATDIAKDAVVP